MKHISITKTAGCQITVTHNKAGCFNRLNATVPAILLSILRKDGKSFALFSAMQ